MSAVTEGITAFSPLAIALLAGFFAARERRQSSSEKIMIRLSSEIAALDSLPEELDVRSLLISQVEATARKYKETCAREDSFKRDGLGIGLGIVLGGGGIALGTGAALQGGAYLWWWVLALPAIVVGVPGFFASLAGERSATSGDETALAEGTPDAAVDGSAVQHVTTTTSPHASDRR
ncbi:hypothetical protein ACFUN8_02780 [Streptomyces sp. NPDC057307]|uniref:hypothetical protein n=1 Tax=Streptomyces sp. NPDC057307 TaxID=3346096 RepID=UPI0036306469